MALTPMEFDDTNSLQEYTPTYETGFSGGTGTQRYKMLDDELVYLEGFFAKTSAISGAVYVCTLPSGIRPKNVTAVNISAGDGNSYYFASGTLFTNGKLLVKCEGTAAKRVYVNTVYSIK